jgi:hypothetical protein
METQLSLFDSATASPPPREFTNTSVTKRAAGVAIRPDAARLRRQVLEFIRQQGAVGATDSEVQLGLSMNGDTERPRRRELQLAGLIADSGQTRSTPSGRAAVVWVAVDQTGAGEPQPGDEIPF